MHSHRAILLAAALCACAVPAHAQQAIYTVAPTLPGKGQVVTRHLLHFTRYDDSGVKGEDFTLLNSVSLGISSELGVQFDLPYRWRDIDGLPGGDVDNSGLLDSALSFKWRVWREDPGPVDTVRLALIGGVELPTGADRASSDSFDSFFGRVVHADRRQHGLSVSAIWKFTTGGVDGDAVLPGDTTADVLNLDGAYLYRLYPAPTGRSSLPRSMAS